MNNDTNKCNKQIHQFRAQLYQSVPFKVLLEEEGKAAVMNVVVEEVVLGIDAEAALEVTCV